MLIKLSFAFMAGFLTTLSPCVLPVLPFVTAASLRQFKAGPLFLVAGLLVSFVGVSLMLTVSGYVFGFNPILMRKSAGALLAVSGALFVSHRLSEAVSTRLSHLGNWASQTSARTSAQNIGGPLFAEFLGGLLLGIVWTPCSGPSLGAALGLAAQSGHISTAALILSVFGLAAVIPLLLFAYGARRLMRVIQTRPQWIEGIKKVFGVAIMAFGVLIVLGMDRQLEAIATRALPNNWLEFVSRY